MRKVSVHQQCWPLRNVFRISRGSYHEVTVVVVEIRDGIAVGRGECRPYARYGESPAGVMAAIETLIPELNRGLERSRLAERLPAGAARNAIDCALWDLEAKRTGVPVWRLAGLPPPQSLTTAYTLSVDSPDNLAEIASKEAGRPLLKLKLAGDGDLKRVAAVRAHAPEAKLIVDANEAWTVADYENFAPALAELGVALLEQPFPAGADEYLVELRRPLAIGADESCHDRASLNRLVGLYDVINIKLDKTGGLTEALRMKQQAREQGFAIMVGCMVATSLSMAPAFLLAQDTEYVDLDGPLLLARDIQPSLRYEGSEVFPPERALWG